jgi:hypothetical protein
MWPSQFVSDLSYIQCRLIVRRNEEVWITVMPNVHSVCSSSSRHCYLSQLRTSKLFCPDTVRQEVTSGTVLYCISASVVILVFCHEKISNLGFRRSVLPPRHEMSHCTRICSLRVLSYVRELERYGVVFIEIMVKYVQYFKYPLISEDI